MLQSESSSYTPFSLTMIHTLRFPKVVLSFDFSLFTVCSLMYPGTAGCRYSIDGYSLGVTSFTQSCSAGLCLATAYPIN
ncbi:hypothetical protein Y032_0186g1061 [Ancylostoma ceylanicum]|uniref:EndoU domain-containing protein n=1 Tax=Ancylostoma ceylanicum TaxID=53326 RepID=A0A016SRU2_9BILA|nr:hypothetical protein Y032_0186g1061 [Ancylostoma ceylanicum]